jgi:hypothetical protein
MAQQWTIACVHVIAGNTTTTVAGGIRRSLDFPDVASVSPGLHQGTSILVTSPFTGLVRRFSSLVKVLPAANTALILCNAV